MKNLLKFLEEPVINIFLKTLLIIYVILIGLEYCLLYYIFKIYDFNLVFVKRIG